MTTVRTGNAAIRLALFLLASLATPALADGLFVWRNEAQDIHEPEQKALIVFDRGMQDLVLEVKYEGAVDDFGWIVPLPSRPKMRADDPGVFEWLSMRSQDPPMPRSKRSLHRGATAGMVKLDDTKVLSRARVGVYDAAVLQASSGGGLERWLGENGFRAPVGAEKTFGEYASRGWVFVALRIAPELADSTTQKKLANGTIAPIRFRFPTAEPVFPLRISALGKSPSDVLLYVVSHEPLVHRTCLRPSWTVNACGLVPRFVEVEPGRGSFPLPDTAQGYLTKLRARIEPADMEDVYFHRYDPIAALKTADRRARLEAIAHLGWLKAADAAPKLAAIAHSDAEDDTTRLSALWALGEIGGLESVHALEASVERGSWDARFEALESLVRVDARAAMPHCIDGLARRDERHTPQGQFAEACVENLILYGDESCIPALRVAIDRLGPPPPLSAWDAAYSTIDRQVLAALAACGDAAAQDSIVRDIVGLGAETTREALRESTQRGGFINDYPGAMWPGTFLIHKMATTRDWQRVVTWSSLLSPRAQVHDAIFRRAAADPSMPPVGRAMLLGSLKSATDASVAELLAIAHGNPDVEPLRVQLVATALRPTERDVSPRTVDLVNYEVETCTAAYALGRLRATDALIALWKERAKSGHDVRGEIAFAMTLADSSVLLPALLDYVRKDWNERAASPGFPADLTRRRMGRGISEHDLDAIDMRYRRDIGHQVARFAGLDAIVRFVTDASFAPWWRLFWAWKLSFYEEETRRRIPEVRAALDDIERSAGSDSLLVTGVESVRRSILIGDKVYAEHVAPAGDRIWRE